MHIPCILKGAENAGSDAHGICLAWQACTMSDAFGRLRMPNPHFTHLVAGLLVFKRGASWLRLSTRAGKSLNAMLRCRRFVGRRPGDGLKSSPRRAAWTEISTEIAPEDWKGPRGREESTTAVSRLHSFSNTPPAASVLLHLLFARPIRLPLPLKLLVRLLLNPLQERFDAHRAFLAQSEASDQRPQRAGAERAVEGRDAALELGGLDGPCEGGSRLWDFGREERGEGGCESRGEEGREKGRGEDVGEEEFCFVFARWVAGKGGWATGEVS